MVVSLPVADLRMLVGASDKLRVERLAVVGDAATVVAGEPAAAAAARVVAAATAAVVAAAAGAAVLVQRERERERARDWQENATIRWMFLVVLTRGKTNPFAQTLLRLTTSKPSSL